MNRPASRPTSTPRFVDGLDFMCVKHPDFPYQALHDVSVYFPAGHPIMPRGHGVSFEHKHIQWGIIRPHSITVKAGYAWNGNTCWLDTAGTMLSSLVHDLLYQFSGCDGWPKHLDRKWADDLYFELSTGWIRHINRAGLSAFSGAFWARERYNGEVAEPFTIIEPT